MVLLVGGAASGKTAVARQLAALADAPLTELALTAATDTGDLLGSFEQVEAARLHRSLHTLAETLVQSLMHALLCGGEEGGGAGGEQGQGAMRVVMDARRMQLAQSVHGAWMTYGRRVAARRAAAAAEGQLASAAHPEELAALRTAVAAAVSAPLLPHALRLLRPVSLLHVTRHSAW
jgi:hypothetical protein